jgi:hypothetical protein
MKLFGWIKGKPSEHEKERRQWHDAWTAALAAEDASRGDELRHQLEALKPDQGEDFEVELEMLDALERLRELQTETAAGTLPVVETHHRVVAAEACHFTTPATLADDPAQPSGRLLFTPTKTVLVGAGKPQSVPWHAVREVIHSERDVLLVRADGAAAAHFRFNTFGDAVAAAFLARRLKGAKGIRAL